MNADEIRRKLGAAGIAAKGLRVRDGEVQAPNLQRARRVAKVLGWGGYQTGWGSWVLVEQCQIGQTTLHRFTGAS